MRMQFKEQNNKLFIWGGPILQIKAAIKAGYTEFNIFKYATEEGFYDIYILISDGNKIDLIKPNAIEKENYNSILKLLKQIPRFVLNKDITIQNYIENKLFYRKGIFKQLDMTKIMPCNYKRALDMNLSELGVIIVFQGYYYKGQYNIKIRLKFYDSNKKEEITFNTINAKTYLYADPLLDKNKIKELKKEFKEWKNYSKLEAINLQIYEYVN